MFLEHTIGYLENEHESFLTVHYILFGSLAYMIVGSLLEGWLFYLYNEKFHPFKKILETDDGIELQNMSELLNIPGNLSQQTKISNSCCYEWIFMWEKYNNFKNVVLMTSDKSKPEKSCSWKKCRDFYERNSGKWIKFCMIISATFLFAVIISIIILGSGLTVPSSKFHSFYR